MVAKAGKNFTPAQNDPVQKSALSHATARQVIVDHETLTQVGPRAKTRSLGEVNFKNLSTPVAIYELLAIENVP